LIGFYIKTLFSFLPLTSLEPKDSWLQMGDDIPLIERPCYKCWKKSSLTPKRIGAELWDCDHCHQINVIIGGIICQDGTIDTKYIDRLTKDFLDQWSVLTKEEPLACNNTPLACNNTPLACHDTPLACHNEKDVKGKNFFEEQTRDKFDDDPVNALGNLFD
jgi:hypothetical protein